MAIEKMHRIRLICTEDAGQDLLEDLMRLGCVEVSEPAELLHESEWNGLLRRGSADCAGLESNISMLASALEHLRKLAPQKKKLLAPRPEVRERAFFSPTGMDDALDVAEIINYETRRLEDMQTARRALEDRLVFLRPWQSCDIPLDYTGGETFGVMLGTCPVFSDPDKLREDLRSTVGECVLYHISADKEQHYIALVYHAAREEDVSAQLKNAGFGRVSFKDIRGLAEENI